VDMNSSRIAVRVGSIQGVVVGVGLCVGIGSARWRDRRRSDGPPRRATRLGAEVYGGSSLLLGPSVSAARRTTPRQHHDRSIALRYLAGRDQDRNPSLP
jgi:hypothetical protein